MLIEGAFGYGEGIGYTLYYATNFIFTGLAVAVAFHAGLFNIGGEGQAYIGGLGVGAGLPGLRQRPALVARPSRWRSSPRRRSARSGPSSRPSCRPSAAATSSSPRSCSTSSPPALMVYLLVDVLQAGRLDGAADARPSLTGAQLPKLGLAARAVRARRSRSAPLNLSFLLALRHGLRWSGC